MGRFSSLVPVARHHARALALLTHGVVKRLRLAARHRAVHLRELLPAGHREILDRLLAQPKAGRLIREQPMTEESDDLGDRSRRGSQGQVVRAAEGLADAFNPAPQVLPFVAGEEAVPIITGNSIEHFLLPLPAAAIVFVIEHAEVLPEEEIAVRCHEREVRVHGAGIDLALVAALVLVLDVQLEENVGNHQLRLATDELTIRCAVDEVLGIRHGVVALPDCALEQVRVAATGLGFFRPRQIEERGRVAPLDQKHEALARAREGCVEKLAREQPAVLRHDDEHLLELAALRLVNRQGVGELPGAPAPR